MKKSDAVSYVQKFARYMEDAPENAKYFVKFPTSYSSKTFHAEDTNILVDLVYEFANRTPTGRKMWNRVKGTIDLTLEDEPEDGIDEEE